VEDDDKERYTVAEISTRAQRISILGIMANLLKKHRPYFSLMPTTQFSVTHTCRYDVQEHIIPFHIENHKLFLRTDKIILMTPIIVLYADGRHLSYL
jgi:hypothetical protein